MKRGIILVFLFFTLTLVIKSQNTIGLSYQDHVSNTINSFLTENIISDYGPRSCGPNCSPWHRGIDLNIPGELDHGNRILSPIAGTVTQIYIAGTYIVLVIKGIDDVNYGYGHIFENYYDNMLPMVSGNFVLGKMKGANSKYLAIIDLANNRAIGPNPGTIEYTSKVNGVTHTDSYQVVSSIQKDWPIAPIGNSNAVYGTHLHLYLVKNAFADPQGINNAKNPLQTIIHQNTNFDISIDGLNNLTEFGSGNFFQGNLRSSVNIKINMPDANQGVSYSNSILDIDSTVLLIKMFGEDDSKYEMIKGDEYYSKIVLGGRLDHKRYPSLGWPISNVYDISKIAGNPKNTGIEPHAYSTTSPFDNYFFLISSREFTKKIYSMD